ncbi:MAG: NmrA family NAD(P)-binding protein [Parerythrobacter sp.]
MQDSEACVVFGATGAQGGAVVNQLINTGKQVRALGRDPSKLKTIASGGAQTFTLSDFTQSMLDDALAGASSAFVCVPITVGLDTDELSGLRSSICDALRRSTVTRVVWTSSWVVTAPGRTVSPGFDAVRQSINEILDLPLQTVVVKPGGYLENLLTPESRIAIAGGVLPYMLPEGLAYRWISSEDQARLVQAVLKADSLESGEYAIGHMATGLELAAAASEALARPIEYTPISPEDFADQWRSEIGSAADRIADDYLDIANHPHWLGLSDDTSLVQRKFDFTYTDLPHFFAAHATELTATS